MSMETESGIEYADHDVQILGAQATVVSGNGDSALIQQEPVSNRGIDHDEIAELVAMRVFVATNVEDAGAVTGSCRAEYGVGININSKAESPTDAFANSPTATAFDSETGDFQTPQTYNYDEPGSLSSYAHAVGTDGLQETTLEYRSFDDLGSGPYVDSTDDITLKIEAVPKGGFGVDAQLQLYVAMYWNVSELPEGRGSFRRP